MILKPKPRQPNKIALLATGDEITNGDILNTNTKNIAQTLVEHNMKVGMHMTSSDDQSDIRCALIFLLKEHDAVIITGGLGPTSDDRTRFALSAALRRPLIFDTPTWERIVERIHRTTKRTPPESNRQQALFPKGATILENPNGTAAGCALYIQGKWVFMLPGPPNECLPMFNTYVLPQLINAKFQHAMFHQKWLLFGVSESEIASQLDSLVDRFDVTTGYRICYPYLECKLHGNSRADFEAAKQAISDAVAPHILGNSKQPVSETLLAQLRTLDFHIDIHDLATGGLLESKLSTPETAKFIHFHKDARENNHLQITITGLQGYWQPCENPPAKTELHICINHTKKQRVTKEVPCYSRKNLLYAVEIASYEVLQYITCT